MSAPHHFNMPGSTDYLSKGLEMAKDPRPYSANYDAIDDLHDNFDEIIESEWRNGLAVGFLVGASIGVAVAFMLGAL